jgi:hypothetical protein
VPRRSSPRHEDSQPRYSPHKPSGMHSSHRRSPFAVFMSTLPPTDLNTPVKESSSEVARRAREITFFESSYAALFSSPLNVLLLMIPAGIVTHYLHVSPIVVFVTNFLAIVPLAGVWSLAPDIDASVARFSDRGDCTRIRRHFRRINECDIWQCCGSDRQRRGIDSGKHRDRSNVPRWIHIIKRAARPGHVFLLWRREEKGTTFQRDRFPHECPQLTKRRRNPQI